MAIVFFSCITPKGVYRECLCGCPTLEESLDALTFLVQADWQLVSVKLTMDCSESLIWLPVEAFDGSPITEALRELQREWEAVLQGR